MWILYRDIRRGPQSCCDLPEIGSGTAKTGNIKIPHIGQLAGELCTKASLSGMIGRNPYAGITLPQSA